MYKVFINEKRLTLGNAPLGIVKNFSFQGPATLEMAIDLLENTSSSDIHVYGDSTEEVFSAFSSFYKKIEAAGGLVKNPKGELLFIHRLGKWDLPKGKIEKDESIETAAVREIEEETGLSDLSIQTPARTTYHTYVERNGTKALKVTYWFHMLYEGSAVPVPQLEEGITKVEWKDTKQIESEVLPSTFKNIQMLLHEENLI